MNRANSILRSLILAPLALLILTVWSLFAETKTPGTTTTGSVWTQLLPTLLAFGVPILGPYES